MAARGGTYGDDVASDLNHLAGLLLTTNRLGEAEPLVRRALAIHETSNHPDVTKSLNNLAELLLATNRLAEAEVLVRRALVITERSLGPNHPDMAVSLSHLASVLQATDRLAEAEPLFRRALTVTEKSLGPDHPTVAIRLSRLALLLQATDRLAEAEPLFRRALTIDESYGPDHPKVAASLNNLAVLLRESNRPAEAEPLYRRSLAIHEKSYGPHHPFVGLNLNNLAFLLHATNRLAEAEPLYRRALAILETSYGPRHPRVAENLNNLALLRAELGDWAEAASLAKAGFVQRSSDLRLAARAVHRAGDGSAEAREEGFGLAQRARQTAAADALGQVAVRFAKGGGRLAAVVREWQDLFARRQREDNRLLAAVGKGDSDAAAALRTSLAGLDRQLDAINRRFAAEFPEYASLAIPRPLAISTVQSLLKDDEALVVFLDVPQPPPFGKLPEETLAWAVTRTEARWSSVPLGTRALAERVARLRCGLDREGNWTQDVQSWRWTGNSQACRALAPNGLADSAPLPFDAVAAHELYAALLAPFADLTGGKSLIVVPSGPLTSLPLHVLVTSPPSPDAGGEQKPPTWLALTTPITVLPSVASLKALRELPPSGAGEPYLAFGNPLLGGGEPKAVALARAKQKCAPSLARQGQAATDRRVADLAALFRGGIDLAMLRAQAALPETADELCAVAQSLGALKNEADAVWLGARATEANLKALSRSGKLARYRVLHFATHGVVAGESEAILKAQAEPGLILTPPKGSPTAPELEEDNGLLGASEIAQLNLDADWVVLSACNTAAGEKGDAEPLAGLARAFFYAKARALLVSHWYVNSEAAVQLTTGAFAELNQHPGIGRAEALRRAMAQLIRHGRSDQARPEYWAPFVLVGAGAG